MSKYGPIVLIENDKDDVHFISELIKSLDVRNEILPFGNGRDALSFLQTTSKQPFIILCDVQIPQMDGLEIRQAIIKDEFLRKKSIPFVFFATSSQRKVVDEAYALTVQGFFRKGYDMEDLRTSLRVIFEYWSRCIHPHTTNE